MYKNFYGQPIDKTSRDPSPEEESPVANLNPVSELIQSLRDQKEREIRRWTHIMLQRAFLVGVFHSSQESSKTIVAGRDIPHFMKELVDEKRPQTSLQIQCVSLVLQISVQKTCNAIEIVLENHDYGNHDALKALMNLWGSENGKTIKAPFKIAPPPAAPTETPINYSGQELVTISQSSIHDFLQRLLLGTSFANIPRTLEKGDSSQSWYFPNQENSIFLITSIPSDPGHMLLYYVGPWQEKMSHLPPQQ